MSLLPPTNSSLSPIPFFMRLPQEIFDEIFSYACTDNGRTGAALSRTCRAIGAASAPHRYQSIGIDKPRHIVGLQNRLQAQPPSLRRVRYLFMSTHNTRDLEDKDKLLEAAANIVSLSSQTVHILFIVHPQPGLDKVLSELSFPNLDRLVLRSQDCQVPPLLMWAPRLEHLHINLRDLPSDFLSATQSYFPRLRRLILYTASEYMPLCRAISNIAGSKPRSRPDVELVSTGVLLIGKPLLRTIPADEEPLSEEEKVSLFDQIYWHVPGYFGPNVDMLSADGIRDEVSFYKGMWEDCLVGGHGCWGILSA